MLIYVRLLCPDFKFRTFFWAAVYVECGTAQGLFECIEAHCEAMDVPIEKIFFYASDGASVVSSDRGGLAGLLRAKSAVLTSTHCLAHREWRIRYALRSPLPSRRRSQASSAAL